ncbi:MAG: GDP-mannose 4,6-dehydratase [Chloroflexi bacterium CG07_land_8_20_14_0_80_51_10]|nr:MAG: GDP-mannose 4,6-dehydratase [Chloroflexi bacterium CG07_land_8_20_14_0_80_51_10]
MDHMKKVVVTGGAGFIGSHLAEELRERGHSVIIIDNLSTGRKENIASLINSTNSITPQTQGVEFIQGSTTNLTLLQEIFKDVQYVFHQAAIASVPQSLEDPLTSNQANLTGTLNVLLAARDNGAKKVIYASSCAVYGDSPVSPKREDMLPAPLSPYAVAKLAGEYYCQVFQEVYGLPTACLRYFNVFGPRQDPDSQYAAVIPKFISRVSEGNSPVVFGDGEQTRDFVFVRDVVEANILIAEGDATGVFNIGRGESVSINQLAELIIGLVGNSVEPIHEEPRPGDIRHSLADISKAKSFGYEPKYSLEEGLVETIEQVGG